MREYTCSRIEYKFKLELKSMKKFLTISESLTMHWELSSEGIFVYLQTDPSLRWVAAAIGKPFPSKTENFPNLCIGEEGSGSMPGMDSILVYNQGTESTICWSTYNYASLCLAR